ncbi:MAG: acyl carrier protein [Sandaracinus sp.]|nr:acyl carrier protein [Myxococcales bacterium]MAT28042.1 acyl carrier protein [Sandaracinus sp.]MBJ71714.1 acyl carrier protein [Sandaracinus sp.]
MAKRARDLHRRRTTRLRYPRGSSGERRARPATRRRALTRDDVLKTVRDILNENFGVPPEKVTAEASFRGTFGLDSLDIVDLVYFLQKAFDFEADLDEYRDLHTVDKLAGFVLAKKGGDATA